MMCFLISIFQAGKEPAEKQAAAKQEGYLQACGCYHGGEHAACLRPFVFIFFKVTSSKI